MLLKVIQISMISLLLFQNEVSADEVRKLPLLLGPNYAIIVEGKSWHWSYDNGRRFWIELQEGTDDKPEGDIGLHMSVKYSPYDYVIFNTWKTDEEWGQEEIHRIPQGYGMPPTRYEIKIIARDDDFQIILNKKEYTYKHRMPKEKLKFLVVGGYFTVKSIKYELIL